MLLVMNRSYYAQLSKLYAVSQFNIFGNYLNYFFLTTTFTDNSKYKLFINNSLGKNKSIFLLVDAFGDRYLEQRK